MEPALISAKFTHEGNSYEKGAHHEKSVDSNAAVKNAMKLPCSGVLIQL